MYDLRKESLQQIREIDNESGAHLREQKVTRVVHLLDRQVSAPAQ